MIAIVRSMTFGGHITYQGQVQVDEVDGVPVFEGALCGSGLPRDEIDDAVTRARAGERRLVGRLPAFSSSSSSVALLRGEPPGRVVYLPLGRVVYLPLVKTDEHDGVPVFKQVALGEFPEDASVAIALAREFGGG